MNHVFMNTFGVLHKRPPRLKLLFRLHTKSAVSQANAAVASTTASSCTKRQVSRPKDGSIPQNARTVTSLQPLVFVPEASNLVLPNNNIRHSLQEAAHKHLLDCDGWKVYSDTQINKLPEVYLKLSKSRLTFFVVMTSMAGYAMAPAPLDITTLIMAAAGTGLTSAAANSINQFLEVPYDSQMSRTKNRALVLGQITPLHAVAFASATAALGVGILYFGCNPLTAALGFTNLILYTSIYTPLKRMSILNTWVGSVVGALPPLMGWAACSGELVPGAWIMAGLLYAWQFPHFNALSWNLRPDYSRAGYRMMSVTNPSLCRRTAVRYTGVIMALSFAAPLLDVTNYWFALESLPLNAYFAHLAWQFYKHSDSASSRKLFRFSLIHLPALMVLLLLNKKYWFLGKDKETVLGSKETQLSSLSQDTDAINEDQLSSPQDIDLDVILTTSNESSLGEEVS